MELYGINNLEAILPKIKLYNKLEIEIGCGNGHFIGQYAQERPNILLMGVELKKRRCLKALKKIEYLSLANVIIVNGKGEEFLQTLPPFSVNKIHIYFPDPWPKTKHRKRRLINMRSLAFMIEKLKEKGVISLYTDVFDYFIQAKVLFILNTRLKLCEEELDSEAVAADKALISIYGKKMRNLERQVYHLSALKRIIG